MNWCHFINFWGQVLNWCQLIKFWGHVLNWCQLIHIWGHVLLTTSREASAFYNLYQFNPSGVYSLLLAKFQISQKRPYMFKHIQSVRIWLEDKCQLGACHRVTRAPQAMAITHWAPCADTTIGFAHSHTTIALHTHTTVALHTHTTIALNTHTTLLSLKTLQWQVLQRHQNGFAHDAEW